MNSTPQHQNFPFFHYYPFMYYLQWNYQQPVSTQIGVNQSNISSTSVSLNEMPEVHPVQRREVAPKQPKQLSQAVKKTKEREKLKKKKEREDDYSRKRQKKDRNLPSNIFRMLTIFIYHHPRILEYIQKHTPKTVSVDPNLFLQKFKATLKPSQSYVRPSVVQELCREGIFSAEESLVFRIIVRAFMKQQFALQVVEQYKLRKGQKISYLKLSRSLYSQLNANFFK